MVALGKLSFFYYLADNLDSIPYVTVPYIHAPYPYSFTGPKELETA